MKSLKILFVKVGLRGHGHFSHSPPMAFAILSGLLKKRCSSEVDTIHAIDGHIKYREVEDLIYDLDEHKPDIIGLSCFSCNHKLLEVFVSIIKSHNSSTIVIVGGPHASIEYNKLANNDNIDFAVIGEGEETLCELVKAISHNTNQFNKIKGIAYKENNSIFITEPRPFCQDLSAVYEHIDHDIIDYDSYDGMMNDILNTGKNASIMTSRGCPFKCAYCHGLAGRKVRRRTIESVISEIEFLVKHKNLKDIKINDDIFNYDLAWAKKFTKVLIEKDFGINLFFQNGLRADLMDEELIDLLLEANTRQIRFAVETASPRLQKLVRKNLNLEKTMKIIKYCQKTSAIADAFFMLGFPSETKEELKQTLAYVEETGMFNPIFNFLNISPNTYIETLYKKYVKNENILPVTTETEGSYNKIIHNAYFYSTEYLRNEFQKVMHKMLSNPDKITQAYKKLSKNLKENDVKIYFSLRYAMPNITKLTLDDLPDNELGKHLKNIAKNSTHLVRKAFGFTSKI